MERSRPSIMAKAYRFALFLVDVIGLLVKMFFGALEAMYRMIVRPKEKNVAGEIVLITGAGHGIGRGLALKYASLGATVVCWDINPRGNQETMSEIKKLGGTKAHAYQCDVANRNEVFETAARVKAEVGDVTILVNNAGIIIYNKFFDITAEEIRRMIDVNVLGNFWMLQAFLPSMVAKNHGHVVALSSMAGFKGIPNFVPYCATKFAIKGLMEALKDELRSAGKKQPSNVKFTTICPWLVDTGYLQNAKIRFPSILSMNQPEVVAHKIVSSQRRNYTVVTIPGFWMPFLKMLEIIPDQVWAPLYDFVYDPLKMDVFNAGGSIFHKR